MKEDLIFLILKFSNGDWEKFHGIEEAKVEEFVAYIWHSMPEQVDSEPEIWIKSIVTEFKNN